MRRRRGPSAGPRGVVRSARPEVCGCWRPRRTYGPHCGSVPATRSRSGAGSDDGSHRRRSPRADAAA